MADLFPEEGDVQGSSPVDNRRSPEAGELPPVGLPQGPAPLEALGLDGQNVVAPTPPRPTKIVKPAYQPLEPSDNRVLSGNPPAPPQRSDLTDADRKVSDYKLLHPDATQAEIIRETGLAQTTVSRSLQKPQVKLYMAGILNAAGATLQKSAKVIAEAHDATKKTYSSFEGVIQDEREDPDHDMRLKAAKVNMEAQGVSEDKGMRVSIYQGLTDAQLIEIESGRARPEQFIETETA